MIRRMMFSVLAGSLLAAVLTFGHSAMAACQGYCADRQPGGLDFDSCTLTIDRNGNVTGVRCFYTGVRIIDEAMVMEGAS